MIGGCRIHGPYSTERCPRCELPTTEETYLSETTIIGGLDLAKEHDFTAFVALEIRDGRARIKGTKIWPHVDYHVVVSDVALLYERLHMRMLAIDATGVGEPVVEMFHARSVKTEDIKFSEYVDWTNVYGEHERAPVKFAMAEYARACLQSKPPKVTFSKGTEELQQQLREQEMVIGATDKPTYRHPSGRHDDLAWAFLMALYASRSWLTGQGVHAIWAH